jgi:D-hexose-6-phosphate mutarotase
MKNYKSTIPSARYFKVGSELHVTVSNLNDDKKIDVTQNAPDEFNDGNAFKVISQKTNMSYTSRTAPSLFDSTTQVEAAHENAKTPQLSCHGT